MATDTKYEDDIRLTPLLQTLDNQNVHDYREAPDTTWDTYNTCRLNIDRLWHGICADVDEKNTKIKTLNAELEVARETNNYLEADLFLKRNECDTLARDLTLVCNEKQLLFDECEAIKIDKDLSELILNQYRDKSSKHKKVSIEGRHYCVIIKHFKGERGRVEFTLK